MTDTRTPEALTLPPSAQAVLDLWPDGGLIVSREQARILMVGARLDLRAATHEQTLDEEEAALAYSALNEAIRHAAVLRTESVTITAPLARYLAARLSRDDDRGVA